MRDDIETRRDFALMVNATIAGIYGKPELTVAQLRMWQLALMDLELDDVKRGLTAHVRDEQAGQFPPKPADVRRGASGGVGAGSLAWGKVARATRLVGAYSSVVFDDAAIHAAVVDLGGWAAVCRTPEGELPHLQRRFEAAYAAHRAAGTRDVPGVLLGVSDAANKAGGFHEFVKPPVLIGDVERCEAIAQLGDASQVGLRRLGASSAPAMAQAVSALAAQRGGA